MENFLKDMVWEVLAVNILVLDLEAIAKYVMHHFFFRCVFAYETIRKEK